MAVHQSKFSPIELAYLAGVIDSDGSITIKRSTYAMRVRGDATQPVYSEMIHIKQVEPQAIELAHCLFGGTRYREKPSTRRGKPLWSWSIHSAAAGRALSALLPYLRIKQAQAENALALRSIMGTGKRRPRIPVEDGEPLISATEFAARAGIDRKSVYQACSQGTIPSVRMGMLRLIPESFVYVRKLGGTPRNATVSAEMERLYLRSKELNRVGID